MCVVTQEREKTSDGGPRKFAAVSVGKKLYSAGK